MPLEIPKEVNLGTAGIPGDVFPVEGLGSATAPRAQRPEILAGPECVDGDHIPEQLRPHLVRLGLVEAVRQVLEAARQTYPDARKVELSAFRDEYGDERVRVNAFVAEEGEEEAEKYFACLAKWADAVPAEAVEKMIFTTS